MSQREEDRKIDNKDSDPGAGENKGRRQLLTLFVIAFVSLGGSYLLFYLASSGVSWGTTNNGAFVEPPTRVDQIGLHLPEQEARLWWLWMVVDDCAESCQQTAKNVKALHILLNREAERVRRGISSPVLSDDNKPSWMTPYPELRILPLAQEHPAEISVLRPAIYIIDPNGNLVFRYDVDTNPKLLLEDLKRLLKVSQIG